MITSIITTDRLQLRKFCIKDLDVFAEMNADPEVMKYFPNPLSYDETKTFLQRIISHYDEYGFGLYAVELRATGEFIGFVGLNAVQFNIPGFEPSSMPTVEIGWRLKQSAWGRGYATEAAKAVMVRAFSDYQLTEVVSFTAKVNAPSQRVMQRLGMLPRGEFLHPKLLSEHPLAEHVLYYQSMS